jgi:acetyl esterase/lipase
LRAQHERRTHTRKTLLAVTAALCGLIGATLVPGAVTAGAAVPPTTLTYCAPAGVALKMDFYRPAGTAKVPVVVEVHSGGWRSYNRKQDVTPGLVDAFLKQNIALASIDYRLGDARLAIEDVACAVRYLRASAKTLMIKGEHIGAMGQSAGGQLVSLLGAAGRADGFNTGQYLKQSSRVQAVVDEWGPVIFDAPLLEKMPYIPAMFGTADLKALAKYSPLTYLTDDDPAFLIVHGAQDATVPVSQSRRFAAALHDHGISQRVIVVNHAGHGLAHAGGAPNPTVAAVQKQVVTFFVSHLR